MDKETIMKIIWSNTHADYRSEVGSPHHPSIMALVGGVTTLVPLKPLTLTQLIELAKKHNIPLPGNPGQLGWGNRAFAEKPWGKGIVSLVKLADPEGGDVWLVDYNDESVGKGLMSTPDFNKARNYFDSLNQGGAGDTAQPSECPHCNSDHIGTWDEGYRCFECGAVFSTNPKGNPRGVKIKPTSITLTRAEGPHEEVGKPQTVTGERHSTWIEADSVLRGWAGTAPESGGYDKIDFVVTYEDGQTYRGRYDLKHWSVESPDLGKHVSRFVKYYAGLYKPPHMSQEQYQQYLSTVTPQTIEETKEFYERYDVGE